MEQEGCNLSSKAHPRLAHPSADSKEIVYGYCNH